MTGFHIMRPYYMKDVAMAISPHHHALKYYRPSIATAVAVAIVATLDDMASLIYICTQNLITEKFHRYSKCKQNYPASP